MARWKRGLPSGKAAYRPEAKIHRPEPSVREILGKTQAQRRRGEKGRHAGAAWTRALLYGPWKTLVAIFGSPPRTFVRHRYTVCKIYLCDIESIFRRICHPS